MLQAPVVAYVRHVESEHNAAASKGSNTHGLRDAPLSTQGHSQLANLSQDFQRFLDSAGFLATGLDRVVAVTSPLTRCLATAMALPRGIRIVAQPLLAEVVHADCDVGRRASLLQAEFPRVSFSLVANHWFLNDAFVDMSADEEPLVADDAWCVDGCPFRPKGALANGTISRVERESEANIAERARCFRRWLDSSGDGHLSGAALVIVISHSGFLRRLLGIPQIANGEMLLRNPLATVVIGPPVVSLPSSSSSSSSDTRRAEWNRLVEHACGYVRSCGDAGATLNGAASVLVLTDALEQASLQQIVHSHGIDHTMCLLPAPSRTLLQTLMAVRLLLRGTPVNNLLVVAPDHMLERVRQACLATLGSTAGYTLQFESVQHRQLDDDDDDDNLSSNCTTKLSALLATEKVLLSHLAADTLAAGLRWPHAPFPSSRFNARGAVARYEGVSFTCTISPASRVFDVLCQMQNVIRESRVGLLFWLPPPSSFHVDLLRLFDGIPAAMTGMATWTQLCSSLVSRCALQCQSASWTSFRVKASQPTAATSDNLESVPLECVSRRVGSALAAWTAAALAACGRAHAVLPPANSLHVRLAYQHAPPTTLEQREELLRVGNELRTLTQTLMTELDLDAPQLVRYVDVADALPVRGTRGRPLLSGVRSSLVVALSADASLACLLKVVRPRRAPDRGQSLQTGLGRNRPGNSPSALLWLFTPVRDGFLAYERTTGSVQLVLAESICSLRNVVCATSLGAPVECPRGATHLITVSHPTGHNAWPPRDCALLYNSATGEMHALDLAHFTGDGLPSDDRATLECRCVRVASTGSARLSSVTAPSHLHVLGYNGIDGDLVVFTLSWSKNGAVLTSVGPPETAYNSLPSGYTDLTAWSAKSTTTSLSSLPPSSSLTTADHVYELLFVNAEREERQTVTLAVPEGVRSASTLDTPSVLRDVAHVHLCALQGVPYLLLQTTLGMVRVCTTALERESEFACVDSSLVVIERY